MRGSLSSGEGAAARSESCAKLPVTIANHVRSAFCVERRQCECSGGPQVIIAGVSRGASRKSRGAAKCHAGERLPDALEYRARSNTVRAPPAASSTLGLPCDGVVDICWPQPHARALGDVLAASGLFRPKLIVRPATTSPAGDVS
jgi:hypothetical protein